MALGPLSLERCPHCGVDTPNLEGVQRLETINSAGTFRRDWCIYRCNRCGSLVTAWGPVSQNPSVSPQGWFPGQEKELSDSIPDRARSYLKQARACPGAPDGAVMLAASSVDAMLKEKGYTDGSLYSRIEKAAVDHLITSEMAAWAHEVRLDANDQRHCDLAATHTTTEDAQRVIDFAMALAEFLFVLPARVQRGRTKAGSP
jgi:Domain of unknown function (DUF4145)